MVAPEIKLLYWLALRCEYEGDIPADLETLNEYVRFIQILAPRQFIDSIDFMQAVVEELKRQWAQQYE